jgi:hypothetical protein
MLALSGLEKYAVRKTSRNPAMAKKNTRQQSNRSTHFENW